jgi:hypothetical protein
MNLPRIAFFLFCLSLISGCATTIPKSPAEYLSGYTYIPLDPFSVKTNPGGSCGFNESNASLNGVDVEKVPYKTLLESLPDNAVRVSIEQYLKSGQVSYGVGSLSGEAQSYKLTVDYINSDTVNEKFWVRKFAEIYDKDATKRKVVAVKLSERTDRGNYTYGSEVFEIIRAEENAKKPEGFEELNVPIYIGIGLRVAATIESSKGSGKITGLGSLSAQADASGLQGFLVTQTLGINGSGVAAALPIQSELNPTTAQNAIASVGAIKALLYKDGTTVSPRVVGLYLPFPGGKPLVNAIVSELSKKRVEWNRPCILELDRNAT